MAAVTVYSDIGTQENKTCHCFHFFPYLPWSDRIGCHDLRFFEYWVLSQLFQSPLSLSSRGSLVSFHFLTLEWLSFACLRLLMFILAVLIPACASSSLAFHMMYFAYKLSKQHDNIQPWCTPFPILNQSVVTCLILTVALTCIQLSQKAGKVTWYSCLFKNIPQ